MSFDYGNSFSIGDWGITIGSGGGSGYGYPSGYPTTYPQYPITGQYPYSGGMSAQTQQMLFLGAILLGAILLLKK